MNIYIYIILYIYEIIMQKRGLARCPINYLVLKGHLVFDDVIIVLGLWMCRRKCMSAVCAILTESSDSPMFNTVGCQSNG